jgi:uncharacterized protein YndB with AHSA1/START domain
MRSHEYVLLDGISRASIGRYITIAAAGVSAGLVFLILQVIDLAQRFGLNAHLTPSVMSLIGAFTVYAVLYALFNRKLWRLPWIGRFLKVPDLDGRWECSGVSQDEIGGTEHAWHGTVSIFQSWDRLRIRMDTPQSGSSSLVAALMHDEAGGYRLFYTYANDPRNDQPELRSHLGYCDMSFDEDQRVATGEYFNGRGRQTFGRMEWRRQS